MASPKGGKGGGAAAKKPGVFTRIGQAVRTGAAVFRGKTAPYAPSRGR